MVLFGHVQHHIVSREFLNKELFVPWDVVYWGGGVDVFFVISGFIMYFQAKDNFGMKGAPQTFMLRRLKRIVPLYWLFTSCMLLVIWQYGRYVVHSDVSITQIIGSYFFVPVRDPYGTFFPVLIAGWTLNFEMLFYCIFAFALNFSRMVGITILSVLLICLASASEWVRGSSPLSFWCNTIVLEFLLGVLLCELYLKLGRWSIVTGLAVFSLGASLMILLKAAGIAEHYWLFRPIWMGLPAFILCAGLVFIKPSEKSGLARKVLVLGGDSSYALYLSHPFVIGLVSLIFIYLRLDDPRLYMLLTIVASFFGATLIYWAFERPIGHVLSGRSSLLTKGRVAPGKAQT